MPQGYTPTAKNRMLTALNVGSLSLHSADPGVDGSAAELAGGSPAYGRKAVVGGSAAADGSRRVSDSVTFDVPAGAVVRWVGQWSTDATPVLLAADEVEERSYQAQGTYVLVQTDDDLNYVPAP